MSAVNDEKQDVALVPEDDAPRSLYARKAASLCTLTLQNAALAICMRIARSRPGVMFAASTAVLMSEVVKLFTCLILHWVAEQFNFKRTFTSLYEAAIKPWKDTLKVGVPSIIYVLQNNCLYYAASNLDVATYQVTSQTKILTTAFFAVVIMRQKLLVTQWAALVVLVCGVVIVQLAPSSPVVSTIQGKDQNKVLGCLAAVTACFLSGFAGVYFEKILKGANVSLFIRNIQLSFLSLPIGLLTCVAKDYSQIVENGFFSGYDPLVWSLVCLFAMGGLLVAASVKYADNVLKNFATSIAIVVSCIFSVFFFHTPLSGEFGVGTSLVIFSIFQYSYKPRSEPRSGEEGKAAPQEKS